MISSSEYGKPKTYDRLQIPNLSVEKRKTSGTGYLDALRTGEGLRSHTLKYRFDFQRPSNQRGKRLSVVPGVISVPNASYRDSRTGGAPAGAPAMRTVPGKPGTRTSANGFGQASTQTTSSQRQGKAARSGNGPKQHAPGTGNAARPSAGSVMDFRKSGAGPAQMSGNINAPNLKDSMQALGLPAKKQPVKGKEAASGAAGAKPSKSGRGFASLLSGKASSAKSARPPKHRPEPKSPSPKTLQKQQKLRGLDQSEPTVVGFDISRSVYQTPAQQEEVKPEAQAVKHKVKNEGPRVKNVLSTVVVIVLVFLCLAFSLSLHERESEVARQNAELEKSIETLKGDVSKAKMAVALEDDLGEIKRHALSLGLDSPDDDQIEYVDLGMEKTYEEQAEPSLQVVSSGSH